MAAFTEERGQALRSINDLLALKNQRKQANADRITGVIQSAGGMWHDATQKEAEREARIAEIESRGGQDRETQMQQYGDLPGGSRQIEDPSTGRMITLNSPADYTLAGHMFQGIRQDVDVEATSDLQQANNEARAKLQGQMDEAAMARLDAGITAEIDAATRQFERMSEDYTEPQSFSSQTTGKTYRWQSAEEFQLVKSQIEQDNYLEAQRIIAGLRGADPDSASKIREAYEFAKMEILWDAQSQSFRNLEDMSDEDLMSTFMDAVDFYKLNEEEANTAYRLFTAFMERNPLEEEAPAAGQSGAPLIRFATTELQDLAGSGVGGALAALPLDTAMQYFGWIPGFNQLINNAARNVTYEYPEGIDRPERQIWGKLLGLVDHVEMTPEDQQTADQYQAALLAAGTSPGSLITRIDDFIKQAIERSKQSQGLGRQTGPNAQGGM